MNNAANEPRRWRIDPAQLGVLTEAAAEQLRVGGKQWTPVIEASAYDALLAERDALKAQVQEAQVMSEAAIEAVQRTTGTASIFVGDENRQRHIRDTLAHEMGKVAAHCVRAVGEHRDELRAELVALKIENDEADTLNTMLSRILTDTAHVLKGTPEALHSHSWADLAQVAAALKEKAERLHSIVLAMARADGRHGFEDIQSIEDAYYRQLEYGVAHPDFLTTSATESREAKGGAE